MPIPPVITVSNLPQPQEPVSKAAVAPSLKAILELAFKPLYLAGVLALVPRITGSDRSNLDHRPYHSHQLLAHGSRLGAAPQRHCQYTRHRHTDAPGGCSVGSAAGLVPVAVHSCLDSSPQPMCGTLHDPKWFHHASGRSPD